MTCAAPNIRRRYRLVKASPVGNRSASAVVISRCRNRKARSSSRFRRSQPVTSSLHLLVLQERQAGTMLSSRVSPATGERQHAVALQRLVGLAAVRAATPRRFERGPLLTAEVVLDAIHPALASAGGPRLATSVGHHRPSVCNRRLPIRVAAKLRQPARWPRTATFGIARLPAIHGRVVRCCRSVLPQSTGRYEPLVTTSLAVATLEVLGQAAAGTWSCERGPELGVLRL